VKIIKFSLLLVLFGAILLNCKGPEDPIAFNETMITDKILIPNIDSFSLNYHLKANYYHDTIDYIEYTYSSLIKDKLKFIKNGKGIKISISNTVSSVTANETILNIHSKNIKFIDLVDFCSFTNTDLISAVGKTLYISQAQNCSLAVNINIANIYTNISGGCYTYLKGGCTQLSLVPINSGCVLYAPYLYVRNIYINTSNNCIVTCYASTTLDIKARLGCTINYFGNPLVTQDISSDCMVIKK